MHRTGLDALDAHLGGGLPAGLLVELAGVSGTGKTQLAFTIVGQILEDQPEACALILQSEGTCAVERLAEICGSEGLQRVLIEHIDTKERLLYFLTQKVAQTEFAAIVIDSVAALFRYEDSYIERGASMLQMTQILKNEIPGSPLLLCLNQATLRGRPALGLGWSNCVNVRLFLKREENGSQRRILLLTHHPGVAKAAFAVSIGLRGVREALVEDGTR